MTHLTIVEDSGEGGNAPEITGTIGLADPIPPDYLQGTYGALEFDADTKTWTYTLDNTRVATQALSRGQTAIEYFFFTDATDGSDATEEVEITVVGVNDAPVVSEEFFNREGPTGERFTLTNLSDRFADVDEGDELTFEVTLDDGTALSTIGLTYDSDEDEITGTLTRTGTYVIKIVATDKSGATVEATFDLNISLGKPMIQRSSLTYNPDETSITIDETMLEVTSGNASDPTLLVYTITTLPDTGMLLRSGTPLNNGDTFTQADINNGLITYVPDVDSLSTSQSNSLSFTFSDGEADGLMETLEITSREVVGNTAPAQDNEIDQSSKTTPQKIDAGDGSDIITSGDGNDQIDGDAGDDEIKLTRDDNGEQVDAGADEVLYEFGYDGVGIDGGDEIVGFKRGQDKVTFVVHDSRQFANLEEFLGSLKGADDEDLTADDAFIVTMQWGTDEAGAFYFDGVLLHFKDTTSFGGGRVSSPLVTVTFDQQLDLNDLTEILGGAEKVADNFDFTHAAFKNLNEVLPRLFGESSIDFVVLPFSNSISVIDGPVTGAEVFFDIDDDGEVSDVEKDAQRDASGRSLYITGDDGSVSIPEEYVGLAFVADVDSAYDTATGERLEGAFRSLDKGRGGIATPITDLIVTYLEEVEGEPNAPTTEQGVLNKIFGDDVIMVADILDMGNYKVPESGAPGEVKKQMIIRAAIALAEIKENDDLADKDESRPATKVEIVSALKTLAAMPDDSSIARLKGAVDARVDEAVAVKGGKPIGTPDDVETTEDTDYEFPETLVDLIELFGFLDPSGNSSSANASAFRGVYIKVAIENGVLLLDDNTPVVESTAGLGDVSVPPITGYIYITRDKLDTLKLRPALDFNGNLELIYRVWDGEQSSSDVTLTITVTSVNDDPVATGSRIVGQNGQVGHAITAIDLSALFTDIDDEIVTLDVFFFDSSIKEVNIGLSYNVADGIIGRPTRFGLYTIEVVASDNRGGEATLEFPILILPDVEGLTKVSGNGGVNAVVGNDEAISSQFLTGGDNAQTLNTGDAGGLIFGGRGDDIINLGDGMDFVIYRYDGADKTDSAAYDGGDVINNFNLSKDILVLAHVGGNVHNNAAAFFDAIKGFSLLVNDNGNITGIVFIFTDRETQTQDIDLTLNFEGSISSEDIDLTAFNAAVDGRRTVKSGQETIAYQALESATEGDGLALINFKDIDFINEIDDATPPSQIPIGDNNIQTLNYGAGGNLIFGGRGDDIINLGDGADLVYYRYDGVDESDSAAFDGGDVINNFDLNEDVLLLFQAEGNIHYDDDITTFFYAIKGVSLLDSGGKITGIVFTFIDRAEGADDDDEIDLTVNLENDDFISSEDIDLTAFNEEVSGRRTIKTGQETAAYQTIIDDVFRSAYQTISDDVFRSALYLNDSVLVSGYGVNGVTIGDEAATSPQYLIGGNNAQTLNAGRGDTGGDLIFGGKDDDIINLGGGGDFILYSYDGADKTDSAAYDGGDVINNFNLDEDELILLHVGNNVHSSTAEFYAAIKGVSLLVGVINGDENITGIVFTFTDRDTPTEEIDLTVNFENACFFCPEITDLTAFNKEVSGRRTIKTGQEIAAYQVIDTILGNTLSLRNFSGNNPPMVATAIGPQRGTVDLPITAIDLEYIFFDVEDGYELTLTVTGLPSGLSYYDRYTGITGTPDTVGTFMVTVVATDRNGATGETTFDIVVSAQAVSPFSPGDGLLDQSGVIREDDPDEELRGTLGNAERELENGIGAFGEIEVDSGGLQTEWVYTLDERAEVLSEGESVTEKFTFTGGDGVDDVVITITVVGVNDAPEIDTPLGIQRGTVDQDININVNNLFTDIDRSDELTLTFTVMLTDGAEATLDDIGLTYDEDRNEITNEITSREITGDPDAGTHRIKAVADDGNGGTVETTFTIQVSPFSVATLDREFGRGVDGAVVNGVSTRAEEFLIGGDNDQTLNTGRDGDYVFGGRGDDTIDLGDGEDVVYYRYGGDDDGLEGIDGHDVIEHFDLDEDFLVLARVGNGIHGDVAAFDDAIRFSTTPNSEGEITGFVITFTGGGSLTVNFDSDDFISGDDQSSNPSLSTVLGNRLQLIHFDNIGFKLNSAETNIIASPDITRLINQSGNGVGDAEVGAGDASSRQFLIGGDNDQTLNASSRGDVIFGGRGDDTINLGNGDGVVYYRYDGVDTDDLESIDGNDTIEDFDRGDDVLVLAYVGDDGDEIIDTTDFYAALKSIKLLVEANDGDDFTGIVFTFTDRSDGAGANDEVVLTVNFYSVFSASSSQIRTIDNAFEDAASGSNERLVKSGKEDDAVAVIEDIVLGEDLQLINFADIGFKLNSIETNAVVLPNVFTFAKELGDGDDNASVGVDTAASSQFLLGGDNVQTLNAGTEGDAIFGGKGDDIINLGGGKDFVFYRYDGDDSDDSEASDGGDEINDFDLDEDVLVLAHESNEVHENANAFYEAIKGISLLVDGDGNVTGIVFTFTDRSNITQEVDLTVNFEDDLTPPAGLEAAFENASSGEREITSGQETAAYGVINEIFGDNLVLIDFDDIGFELNNAETDIV